MKLIAAHNYKPMGKINANTILIKPTENYTKLANDYGLNEVSFRKYRCLSRIQSIEFYQSQIYLQNSLSLYSSAQSQ